MQSNVDGLTVGRIVHYVEEEGWHRAAIVSLVNNPNIMGKGNVNLTVFSDHPSNPVVVRTAVPHDEVHKKSGTWHWIEKA